MEPSHEPHEREPELPDDHPSAGLWGPNEPFSAHAEPRSARDVLEDVFGFSEFRPQQEAIIDTVLVGEDAFVLMPTGGGKSLCYQIPALLMPGPAIVISPLISLMHDQVAALRANGVRAAALNSTLGAGDARDVVRALHRHELDLVYVSPERASMPSFVSLARDFGPSLLAVDEAHCVSMWGHDFRPEYARLARVREALPDIPLIALTATADPQTREDVRRVLGLQDARTFVASFDRPNIRYSIIEKRRPKKQLVRFMRTHADDSGIIYCLSRKRVERVARHLVKHGFDAAPYHAGLSNGERDDVQRRFTRDDLAVVVATVAFGMGIDKSNVRFVVHYDLPKTVEAYYQETGRAGRDGLPSEALALFGMGDIVTARSLIARTQNPQQRRVEEHKLNAMVSLATGQSCRRQALLGYFGETLEDACGNCDICLHPPESYDGTVDAQKVLSCVYRVDQRYGAGYVVDILLGSKKKRILRNGHDRLSTWGIGSKEGRDHWHHVVTQLIHRGLLEQDIANYSILKLTERARPVLLGDASIELARLRDYDARGGRPKSGARSKRRSRGPEIADPGLFQELRVLRKSLADEAGIPAFAVFSDATLAEMCERKPVDADELIAVSGVGQVKLERYGQDFLRAIRLWVAQDAELDGLMEDM